MKNLALEKIVFFFLLENQVNAITHVGCSIYKRKMVEAKRKSGLDVLKSVMIFFKKRSLRAEFTHLQSISSTFYARVFRAKVRSKPKRI